MKYIIILIILAIVAFIILRSIHKKKESIERLKEAAKDQRSIEEIFSGRTMDEVFEELDKKEYDELSPNESEALLAIHLQWEHNSPNLDNKPDHLK